MKIVGSISNTGPPCITTSAVGVHIKFPNPVCDMCSGKVCDKKVVICNPNLCREENCVKYEVNAALARQLQFTFLAFRNTTSMFLPLVVLMHLGNNLQRQYLVC